MEERRSDFIKRFANIWGISRSDAGMSQEDMAIEMGVSRHTIQNWEKGLSAPDLFQTIEWFKLLNINPLQYFMKFMYGGFNWNDENKDIDTEIINTMQGILSPKEKRQLLYLMQSGNFNGILQLSMTDNFLSLKSRVNIAKLLVSEYEMETAISGENCPKELSPELDLLKKSIIKAEYAVINRKNAYTTIDESEWRNEDE